MNKLISRNFKFAAPFAILVLGLSFFGKTGRAGELEINQLAPDFELLNQDGKTFKLSDRKGSWTVIYFYPKSGSPGCTEQACAFRDGIKKIEARKATLVGISADTKEAQKEFHAANKLNFDLLADTDAKVIVSYGVKMPVFGMAKRTTFIVDPELKIRSITKDVDPAFDSEWTAETLDELQGAEDAAASAVAKPVSHSDSAVAPEVTKDPGKAAAEPVGNEKEKGSVGGGKQKAPHKQVAPKLDKSQGKK